MKDHPAARLREASLDADERARQLVRQGRPVVRTLGDGLPLALVRASGMSPVALAPAEASAAALPQVELDAQGRARLAAVLAAPAGQPVLLSTHDAAGARLFAILRELVRCGEMPARPLHGVDLLRPRDAALVRYNRERLAELAAWLASCGGISVTPTDLAMAITVEDRQRDPLRQLDGWRMRSDARIAASDWHAARRAGGVLDQEEHLSLLQAWLEVASQAPVLDGERVFVAGVLEAPEGVLEVLEKLGRQVVADDSALDDDPLGCAVEDADPWPWEVLARRAVQPGAIDPQARARWSVDRAREAGATRLLHLRCDGDEAQAWLRPCLVEECRRAGIEFVPLDLLASAPLLKTLRRALSAETAMPDRPAAARAKGTGAQGSAASPKPPQHEQRSRKSLQAVADFGRHQRDWFQSVRRRALDGEPFAVVNADAPQELLRALDIPFVVNQWWASIVAAKQQSGRYLDLLRAHGYPTDAEPYSAQGLAAAFDEDPELAPWGGLPRPQWLMAFSGTPATRGIHSAWARHTGAELCVFDRTVDTRLDLPLEWWSRLPHEWDELLERPRLDLIEREFSAVIERLQRTTGRRFDEARFVEVMQLVNEQEDYYRLTRDLVASCPRAPVGIVDTMPATMVPQWHRGTVWGRDAARTLYEEVRARAEAGEAACAGEQLRLMWVGRGLWSDLGFYQRWEASHGAVFVWSMYLALAADGYLRYWRDDQSPLRALAARFVTMGDELRMPTWAGAWHLREARTHRVDAAVAIDDADPLVLRTLQSAGIPVLRLALDNFAQGIDGREMAAAQVTSFLDGLRRGGPR